MQASFESRADGDIIIIDVSGRLTLGDPVVSFREAVSSASADGNGKVVLNLRSLDYIDSAGLGELIDISRHCVLKLVNLPKRVEDLLRLSNSYSLFEVHPDEQAAIRSFL